MSQKSILPILGISPIEAFQRAEMGVSPRPSAMVQSTMPRIVGADVPAAPIAVKPVTRMDMPLGRAAMQGAAGMGGGVMPLPQDPSMLRRLQADKPFAAGLQAAGEALAAASGYTAQPKDTLTMLNQAMAAFNKAQQQRAMFEADAAMKRQIRAEDRAFEERKLKQARELAEMQYGKVSDEKTFSQEKDLRKEYSTASKDFVEAKLGFEKVQNAALAKTPSGANDIALIFGYMKVLDPNSVVREGEFATAEDAGGVGSKILNTYNRVVKGERLTPEVRAQFVRSARTQFAPYLQQQQAREAEFTQLSESYDLDPKKIVMSKLPKQGSLAMPFVFQSLEEAEGLPKGTYIMVKGRLARIK